MQTRKSHSKSRNGCETCKRRRVKCDEQGPPCANCVIRKTPCNYIRSIDMRHLAAPPQATTSSSAGSSPGSASASASTSASASGLTSASTSTLESTSVPSAESSSLRLLELELMHRWSTSTYKSVCSIASEEHLLKVTVPRDALKHPYLLDCVFAFAALDLAVASPEPADQASYARAGLDYHDRALRGFHAELGNIAPENHLPIFIVSTLLLPLNIARPQLVPAGGDRPRISARDSVLALFDLMACTALVATTTWDLLEAGPVQTRAWINQDVPVHLLDAGTKAAVARLHALNDGHRRDGPEAAAHESYQTKILHLEGCFARDIEASVKGSCLAWVGLTRGDFAEKFRRAEPLALIIMMHWGVLVENLGREAWWANQAGRNLVMELSGELQKLGFDSLPVWQESISWTRQQVGLPPLV